MKYLWTEDTCAGYHFWQLVNQLAFDNSLIVNFVCKAWNSGGFRPILNRFSGCFKGCLRIYFEAAGFTRPENENSGVRR